MLDLLVHGGALAFLIAAPIVGASARAIRDYRREERGELARIGVDDAFMRRG